MRGQATKGFLLLFLLTIIVLGGHQLTSKIVTAGGDELSNDRIIGKGEGYKGDIVLEVIMANDELKEIKAVEFHDTSHAFNLVLNRVEEELQQGQTLSEIDTITGATATFDGIIEALEKAFDQINDKKQ